MGRICTTIWIAPFALLAGCVTIGVPGSASSYPRVSTAVRSTLAAALETHDREAVTRNTLLLLDMGASLQDSTFDRIVPDLDPARIRAHRWYDKRRGEPIAWLRESFRNNGLTRAVGIYDDSRLFAEVPAEYRLVEGIAYDRQTDRLFIGTVVDGRLAYHDNGDWHEVALGNPRSGLFGMAIDQQRRMLWIATGSVEQTAVEGARMTGLIAVDLDTLRVARRVPVADGATPGVANDLVIGPDGTVYVSNSVTGAIQRCVVGCTQLDALLPAGSFSSPQGLSLSDKSDRLYVADYETGLWLVSIGSGKREPVLSTEPRMFEGIDGLLGFSKDIMVGIQNGTRPRRIIRLGPEIGRHRLRFDVYETRGESGGEPTLGTIKPSTPTDPGGLLYIADGQWDRFGAGGVLVDGAPPRKTPIRINPLEGSIVAGR